jgi:hypothetical protein
MQVSTVGYDLHITRKSSWGDDDGPTISLPEWQHFVERDPELSAYRDVGEEDSDRFASWRDQQGVLVWDGGEVRSRNPDKSLVIKMVAIAAALYAQVQGDDEEIYGADGTARPSLAAEPTPPPSLLSRIRSWFRSRRTTRSLQSAAPAFKIGSRVRDPWGSCGTILEVDRRAMGGLGRVVVRFDDGREQGVAYVASGLELDGGAPATD